MITVKCVGGACDGRSVKIEPTNVYFEVVDPRDRTVRDLYVFEAPTADHPARLVVAR